MGRYGIDYESVVEVADTLAAQGQTATVERVRAALGTGSYTTLGRHLQMWRRARAPAQNDGTALPEMINDAAQAVWANLNRAAQEQVAQAEVAAQTAVADAAMRAQTECASMQAELDAQITAHAQALEHNRQMQDTQIRALKVAEAARVQSEAARESLHEKLNVYAGFLARIETFLGAEQESAQSFRDKTHDRLDALRAATSDLGVALAESLKQSYASGAETRTSIANFVIEGNKQLNLLKTSIDGQSALIAALGQVPQALQLLKQTVLKLSADQLTSAKMTQNVLARLEAIEEKNVQMEKRQETVSDFLAKVAQNTSPAAQESFNKRHQIVLLDQVKDHLDRVMTTLWHSREQS